MTSNDTPFAGAAHDTPHIVILALYGNGGAA